MRFKAMVSVPIALVAVVMASGTAGADPSNASRSIQLDLECEVLGDLTITVNGNGRFSPGLVSGSTQVGTPYEIHNTITFTAPDGTTEVEHEDFSRPAPRNSRHDECTFSALLEFEYGTVEIDGHALITYTPTR